MGCGGHGHGQVLKVNWRNEGELTSAFLKAANQIPGVMANRRSVGRRGYIKFGISGEADCQGWVAPNGKGWAVEFKMPGGERSPEQVAWALSVQAVGVAYLCTESYDEALEFVRAIVRQELYTQS